MRNHIWNGAIRSMNGRGPVCFVIAALVLGCCPLALGTTKEELIIEIEARRIAIQDLDVQFVFFAVGQIPGNAVQRDARRVVLEANNKMLIQRAYRIGDTILETTASLTGTRGWGYQAVNKRAYTRVGADIPLVETEGSGFFDLMMWYPCAIARTGELHPNDLLSVLDSQDSQLLPQPEIINGHACHVVEVLDAANVVVARVWIDPEVGYLPVMQEYYSLCPAPETILVAFEIDNAVEVIDDVWLPVSGERATGVIADVEELSNGLYYRMAVQSDQSGLRLKVNQGVDDSVFDLSTQLPSGTMVADLDNGEVWMASARDYSAAADSSLASVTDFKQRSSDRRDQLRDQNLTGEIGWLALMAAAGLSGAGLQLVRQRRVRG